MILQNIPETGSNGKRMAKRGGLNSIKSWMKSPYGGIKDISVLENPLVNVVSMSVHPSPLKPHLPVFSNVRPDESVF